MKNFIINISMFVVLFFVILVSTITFSSKLVSSRNFKNWETESNLLILKDHASYDLAFMGISHARNFSRHKNHLRIEKALNRKILNIGQGEGRCGINEQLFYLKYFYSHNVEINKIIYVLSPSLLYAKFLNQASNTFNREPFKFDFFLSYLKFECENKWQRLFYYTKSKLHPRWLFLVPKSLEKKEKKLKCLDREKVNEGLKEAYLDGEDLKIFEKNCNKVEKTIIEAYRHRTKVTFIIPPALFGKWKGHSEAIEFAKNMKKKYGTAYYDNSESVLNPEYYFDHHHLNSDGIDYFVEKYFKLTLND